MAVSVAKKTVKTADDIKSAVVLRDAGYSLASIAQRTNISASTLSRHFTKYGMVKGSLTTHAVNDARQQLLNDGGFISDLKHHIAAAVVDDISQIIALRSAISITLDDLMQDASLPATYRSRAIAALATSINLSQTALRKTLSMDNQPIEQESLPDLFITELTQEDIEHLRQEQLITASLDSQPDHDNDVIDECG